MLASVFARDMIIGWVNQTSQMRFSFAGHLRETMASDKKCAIGYRNWSINGDGKAFAKKASTQ